MLVQEKRESKATTRFIKKIRRTVKQPISKAVTDKFKNHIKPVKRLLATTPNITQQYTNNRSENSHQSTRLKEKKMRKFKSLKKHNDSYRALEISTTISTPQGIDDQLKYLEF